MQHRPELSAALLICTSLVVGAIMRGVSSRLHIPYTVAVLIAGIAIGAGLHSLGDDPAQLPGLAGHLAAGAHISPDLIVFVFLPILVFESAFVTDVYTFRRNLGPVLLLAGPIMLLAAGLTAIIATWITPAHWGWTALEALVFGALISATDPVAVVALLREMGAPKRLALLVEGESLLNDGTAIVVFGILLGLLTGNLDFELSGSLLHFAWVCLGGLFVGLSLGAAITSWLSRTFNAPLVEITLTIVLAYGAMLLAEDVLHVSGVIALVTAGLWMSAQGRLAISPEVSHFLHRFWEMLAYLANTLIFFLVGLVIAGQLDRAVGIDLLHVLGLFIAIVLLRLGLVFAARPLMQWVGAPVSPGEALVLAWGGLRGAVSLALALIASQHPAVPEGFGEELLLATAGVVLLTILMGGSGMGPLLRRLHFDRPAAADRLADALTKRAALEEVERHVRNISHTRDLRTVDWNEVHREIKSRSRELDREISRARSELEAKGDGEVRGGFWRQALNIERQGVWSAFADGTLGADAARILDHEIDLQLEALARGAARPASDRHPAPSGWRTRLSPMLDTLLLARGTRRFARLAQRYDLHRAELLMADRVLHELQVRADLDPHAREEMLEYYRRAMHQAKERLEDLRVNLPEITGAIETRLARRTQLNLERESYYALARLGALDPQRFEEALADVERRMKALGQADQRVPLPQTSELCRNEPLFAGLDQNGIDLLAALTVEKVFAPGEILCLEGERGESLFIIARGAVDIFQGSGTREGESTLLDVLGGGDILGEMALLTGATRNATARAATTVTVGEISRRDFERLCEAQPDLREGIWHGFGARCFDNCLRTLPDYQHLGHADRLAWFERGQERQLRKGEILQPPADQVIFVFHGRLRTEDGVQAAPCMLAPGTACNASALEQSRIALLPAFRRIPRTPLTPLTKPDDFTLQSGSPNQEAGNASQRNG